MDGKGTSVSQLLVTSNEFTMLIALVLILTSTVKEPSKQSPEFKVSAFRRALSTSLPTIRSIGATALLPMLMTGLYMRSIGIPS